MEHLTAETTERMQALIQGFPAQRMMVIGDLVLDQFVYGVSSRISREAPVLILRHSHTENAPGGAGNAAANLKALGAEVWLVGFIGPDENGRLLTEILSRYGISSGGIFPVIGAQTTTKSRIMGGLPHSSAQQIVRIDHEFAGRLGGVREAEILEYLSHHLPKCTGVIISDYGYGAITAAIRDFAVEFCREQRIPLIVDSRFRLRWFQGVTAITPNITEVEEAFGIRFENQLEAIEPVAREIMDRQRLQALLVTRGKYGMLLYEPSGTLCNIPVFGSDQVADVTGAGDTVIAAFSLALSAHAGFADAARLSNFAGGLVVMKHGTATVSATELLEAVRSTLPPCTK